MRIFPPFFIKIKKFHTFSNQLQWEMRVLTSYQVALMRSNEACSVKAWTCEMLSAVNSY